jgi:hypothetical protein
MIQQATRSTPRADLGVAFHEFTPDGMTFVAEEVLPVLNVAKEAATISVITRENARTVDNKHANGAGFGRVHLGSEDKSYSTADYGLEGQLTDGDRERFMDDYEPEIETVQVVKTHMLMAKEIRAAAALFNTTTWTGSDLTTDVTGDWDAAGSDVLGHVEAAVEQVRKNTGLKADSMLIGPVTYKNIKHNTAILAKFGSNPSVLTPSVWRRYIAEILDLQNIFVADGVYNSAAEGQTASMADIWSDDYALIFKRQSGSLAMPGLGRTVRWMGPAGVLVNGLENVVQYREEQTESDIFRIREYVGEFICDPYFGHLLQIDT